MATIDASTLAEPGHDPTCTCAACDAYYLTVPRPPAPPKPKSDPRLKDKLDILSRRAQERALALTQDGRIGLLAQCGAPLGDTTVTWWNGGVTNAFNGIKDTKPWLGFGAQITAIASMVQAKGTGYYFTPAISINGRRRNEDIDAITQLGLDCDGFGHWATFQSAMSQAGLAYIIDTSCSSTAEAPKWHTHLPFPEPLGRTTHDGIDGDGWRMIYRWCVAWFGVLAGLRIEPQHEERKYRYGFDHAPGAMGNPWFPGTRRAETDAAPAVIVADGKAFDIGTFLDLTGFSEAEDETDKELAAKPHFVPTPHVTATEWTEDEVIKAAIKWIAKRPARLRTYDAAGNKTSSGNHNRCLVVAGDLVRGFCLDEDVALDIMLEHYNPRCNPEWTESELVHKIESAARGPRSEGTLLDLMERDKQQERRREALRQLAAKRGIARPKPEPNAAPVTTTADAGNGGTTPMEDFSADASPDQDPTTPFEDDLSEVEVDVEMILAIVHAGAGTDERNDLANSPEVAAMAATLGEKSAEFLRLEASLQREGVSIQAWRKMVRAARIDAAPTAAEVVATELKRETATRQVRIHVTFAEHEVNDKAAAALKNLPSIFVYGQVLVDMVTNKRTKMTSIHPLSVHGVRESISRVCTFFQMTGETPPTPFDVGVPKFCPPAVIGRGQWRELRLLTGIVPYPFVVPSGAIHTKEGYEEETGNFFQPNFVPLPVPDRPTEKERREAMDKLMYVVKDFPFKDARDTRIDETPEQTFARLSQSDHFAAFLAAWLTPPTRPAYTGPSPGYGLNGNRPGVGKDKLKETLEQTWLGYEMDSGVQAVGFGAEAENEDRKKIMTLVMKATPMVAINNIAKPFGNATWAAALTQNTWSDRVLSTMVAPVCPLKITFYFNGVNLLWSDHMPRRILDIMIETPLHLPQQRTDFSEPDLIAYVKDHRAELVQACLTILRAWTVTKNKVDDLPNPGSTGNFDAWSKVVRGAILHAGMRDPWNRNVALSGDGDEDTPKHTSLLDGLAEAIIELQKPGGVTCREVLVAMKANDDASASWRGNPERVKFVKLRAAFAEAFPGLKQGVLPTDAALGRDALAPRLNAPSADGRILRKKRDGSRQYWIENPNNVETTVTIPPRPAGGGAADGGKGTGAPVGPTAPQSGAAKGGNTLYEGSAAVAPSSAANKNDESA